MSNRQSRQRLHARPSRAEAAPRPPRAESPPVRAPPPSLRPGGRPSPAIGAMPTTMRNPARLSDSAIRYRPSCAPHPARAGTDRPAPRLSPAPACRPPLTPLAFRERASDLPPAIRFHAALSSPCTRRPLRLSRPCRAGVRTAVRCRRASHIQEREPRTTIRTRRWSIPPTRRGKTMSTTYGDVGRARGDRARPQDAAGRSGGLEPAIPTS